MISIPKLGINPNKDYRDIKPNETVEFVNRNLFTLDFADLGAEYELDIEVDVRIKNDTRIITFTNIYPSDPDIKFEMASVNFENQWEYIRVRQNKLPSYEASFPGDGDGIDLSALAQYLNGFTFKGIESYFYIRGPSVFFDLAPDVNIGMAFTGKNGNPVKDDLVDISVGVDKNADDPLLTLDPDKPNEYSGILPEKGKIPLDLKAVLEAWPDDLRFDYKIKVANDEIHKDWLDRIDEIKNDPFKIDILLKLPLVLESGQDANISLTDITGDNSEDFLGRTPDSDGDSPLEWIKSLNLRVDFTADVFTGGELYLDDGVHPITAPLSGKSLNLKIKDTDLDHINRTIPYTPKAGIRFKEGATLELPRDLGISKIHFDADIVAKFDLKGGDK
jgi:hypothetical protein